MNHRERVLSAIAKQGYDRIPVKHVGTPEVNAMLMKSFRIDNHEQLLRVLGDDFREITADYIGPKLQTFSDGVEGYWGERYTYAQFEEGRYLEASYLPFAGVETLNDLDRSHFPSADWFDYSTIKTKCEAYKGEYALIFGSAGDMDFINGIARAKGMEEVLIDLVTDNEAFLEIMNARFEFYFNMHERVLRAADGLIDIAHIGEDLGTQLGPMIGRDIFEKHFAPKYRKYFDMAHSYGAKTMMHMCGCVESFLPRLIELGLDIQDVVQPAGNTMDIAYLKEHYGGKLTFCGSMCVQSVLPYGSETDVIVEVDRRLELFENGGLILGPTHAIQVKTPLRNIEVMYRRAGSLIKNIDNSMLSVSGNKARTGMISLSKLF